MNLDRVAWAYLQRYETTERNFVQVMRRKAARRELEPSILTAWLGPFIERAKKLDWINDRRYATNRARNWHARGWGVRKIQGKLREKGVSSELIQAVLTDYRTDDSELKAAMRYAKKRRIGPYRLDEGPLSPEQRRKDLGKLARSGFSYGVADRVLNSERPEEERSPWAW